MTNVPLKTATAALATFVSGESVSEQKLYQTVIVEQMLSAEDEIDELRIHDGQLDAVKVDAIL
ncbi:hypothetical protein D918_07127 [Trichuris suis]|nr:hypothetical protein D918_07127 [Trichuris suis]